MKTLELVKQIQAYIRSNTKLLTDFELRQTGCTIYSTDGNVRIFVNCYEDGEHNLAFPAYPNIGAEFTSFETFQIEFKKMIDRYKQYRMKQMETEINNLIVK